MRAARSWREKGVDGGIGRVQRKGGGDEESYREGERKEGYATLSIGNRFTLIVCHLQCNWGMSNTQI